MANDSKLQALRAEEAFQVAREVTTDLLRAQHENRLLTLENERLRQQLLEVAKGTPSHPALLSGSAPMAALDLPSSAARGDGIARLLGGTQSDAPGLRADERAELYSVGEACEQQLEALRDTSA
ncbi:hypothetical protein KFE25_000596 [Diacronema lutheri]|uniref:Uncharacterized protein n=1 Tax=Diacronema lutheri TaxID=2081491 RepID=A0A8J5XSV4_DIALT|nr:hypothetical protein KFE25_000596 [Diacronema lutheri]